MEDHRLSENDEDVAQRVEILQHLLDVVKKWMKRVVEHISESDTREDKPVRLPIQAVLDPRGLVFSYGSFGLRTESPGVLPFSPSSNCICTA